MMKEKKKFQPLNSKNVCQIYELIKLDSHILFQIPPDGIGKIESLVANINGSNFGIQNYKTFEQRIVAYMYFIIKNHPFIDGNKRTAVLSFIILCDLNKISFSYEKEFLDSMAVFIEKTSDDHKIIIETLSKFLFGTDM